MIIDAEFIVPRAPKCPVVLLSSPPIPGIGALKTKVVSGHILVDHNRVLVARIVIPEQKNLVPLIQQFGLNIADIASGKAQLCRPDFVLAPA